MNVYAKFRDFPLRINEALGIYQKRVTTPTRRRTTVVALRDPSRSKNTRRWRSHHKTVCGSLYTYIRHCMKHLNTAIKRLLSYAEHLTADKSRISRTCLKSLVLGFDAQSGSVSYNRLALKA